MTNQKFKNYIILVRAPSFGAPFDDGAWHLVVEDDDYNIARLSVAEMVPVLEDIDAEVLMLLSVRGKRRGEVSFKARGMKLKGELVLPSSSEIVRSSIEELRDLNVIIGAGKLRFNPVAWAKFVEVNDVGSMSVRVQEAVRKRAPMTRFHAPKKPKASFRDWLTSPRGAWSLTGIAGAVGVVAALSFALPSSQVGREVISAAALRDYRQGAFDLVQVDPANPRKMLRLRVFPDGSKTVLGWQTTQWVKPSTPNRFIVD